MVALLRPCLWVVLSFFIMQGCATTDPLRGGSSSNEQIQKESREILASDLKFDASTGVIVYTLPEDGYVRIRLGLTNGGPMLAHLLDWDLRSQGPHKESWDGRVGGGTVDYRNRGDLIITFNAVSVPVPDVGVSKNSRIRTAPKFEIIFPDLTDRQDTEYPTLSGRAAVRIAVPEETMQWLSSVNYEIALFFDDLFVIEEEEGVNPFTYYIDTRQYNNGLHRITVNVLSSSGEAGTMTKIIRIQN